MRISNIYVDKILSISCQVVLWFTSILPIIEKKLHFSANAEYSTLTKHAFHIKDSRFQPGLNRPGLKNGAGIFGMLLMIYSPSKISSPSSENELLQPQAKNWFFFRSFFPFFFFVFL